VAATEAVPVPGDYGPSLPWVAATVPPAVERLVADGVPPGMARVLARRGVCSGEEAERFLAPRLEHLHDGLRFAGMERALDLLAAARQRAETVAVVGDYDVDGVSATALLLAALRALGLAVEAILPHRLHDGYGLQHAHVEAAVARGARLLLTVDCGSTAHGPLTAALASGLAVVVVDHHLPDRPLPPPVAHINPHQEGCPYPFRQLAAAGLALKLALALGDRLERPLPIDALLRIACLGTVADMVPLVGENRVIAALGLRALASTRSRGLRALFRQARLEPPLTATDVGFRIGPRLNAAGRLGSAEPALELLLTRDALRAEELSQQLEQLNAARQLAEQRVVEEATAQLATRGELPPLLVAWSAEWHRGVVGIAASRLMRAHGRPALLLAVEGELASGSGRSVPGVELHHFLARWRGELERFGGHAQAVGLTVRADRLPALAAAWEAAAAAEWPPEAAGRAHVYELEVPTRRLGEDLLARLERLQPHGEGNPQPLVRVGPLRLVGSPRVFGKGHVRALATGADGGRAVLLGWGWAQRAASWSRWFEVLAYVERDRRLGTPELRLVDSRPAGDELGR
jgi:single-stranded-DNA-specific exonuclease